MNKLRDAAQQALEALENCGSEYGHRCSRCDSEVDEGGKVVAALRAALAEPQPQPEPVAFTFAGLTVREIQIPAGMTVRIDRDAIIVARQRDQNDPLIVEPQHDPSHLPYAALAEPQPEPVAWMHTQIECNVITHKPRDLDRHPDRWIPLFKDPTPCKTCQALAMAVMADQTSHDTRPPQRQPLSDEEIARLWSWAGKRAQGFARALEKAHGIGGAT